MQYEWTRMGKAPFSYNRGLWGMRVNHANSMVQPHTNTRDHRVKLWRILPCCEWIKDTQRRREVGICDDKRSQDARYEVHGMSCHKGTRVSVANV